MQNVNYNNCMEYKKTQKFDFSDPSGEELLMQAANVFGVNSNDDESDNFAKLENCGD